MTILKFWYIKWLLWLLPTYLRSKITIFSISNWSSHLSVVLGKLLFCYSTSVLPVRWTGRINVGYRRVGEITIGYRLHDDEQVELHTATDGWVEL